MLTDINYEIKPREYEMTLCKMNEKEIQNIKDYFDLNYKKSAIDINELSFSIPKKIENEYGILEDNIIYDELHGDMLIKLNEEEFFLIVEVDEIESADGNYKNIVAFGREFELSRKFYRGYKSDSITLYEEVLPNNWANGGVLNYIEYLTTWRIDYYDQSFASVYRGIDISENNIIEVLNQLQEKYGCLFTFDSINKTISVYQPENLFVDTGFYISDRKYIESISKKINHDEIKTRLKIYGEDDYSIENITINGQDYIDNFEYYKNSGLMSQELVDRLNQYEQDLEPFETDFNNYLNQLDTKNSEILIAESNLLTAQQELIEAEDNLDLAIARQSEDTESYSTLSSFPATGESDIIYIATDTGLTYLWNSDPDFLSYIEIEYLTVAEARSELETAQTNLDNAQSALITLESDKTIIEGNIETLRSNLETIEITDSELLGELDSFIKEETFRDATYKPEMIQELYEEGVNLLAQISQPSLYLETSIVDFLKVIECQHDWNKLVVGNLITVYNENLNINLELKLIGYTHNEENGQLTLQISNKYNYKDPYAYENDLLGELSATATKVDFSKYNWDKYNDDESLISNFINGELDAAKNQIVTADGQAPIIDHRGIWLRKITNDVTEPKQIRMINNVIAITNDNWNTVSTAITGNGINAEVVRGKLGVFAKLDSHQVTVSPSNEVEPGSLSDFNGVSINSDDGIKVTRTDGGITTILNATEGIKITNGTEDVFYADIEGNLNIKGNITLTDGYINWENVNQFDVPPGYTDAEAISAIETTYIDANGVWTPEVYAENINTLNAKISTAQIETLTVGSNVIMGPSATISWSQVTSQPSIPDVPSYITSTKITSTTIESPTITAGELIGTTVTGGTVQTSNSGKRITLNGSANDLEVFDSGGVLSFIVDYDTNGISPDAANRIFLRTENDRALKIESQGANMSLEASGTGNRIWMMSDVTFASGNSVTFSGEVTGLTAQFG